MRGQGAWEREPVVARLRREGKLWPQTLTDVELEKELLGVDTNESPISARMLSEEWTKRRQR